MHYCSISSFQKGQHLDVLLPLCFHQRAHHLLPCSNQPLPTPPHCLFPLLLSLMSKKCQYRLMANLSDLKQCSLWLECVTTRLQSARLWTAFTCLPVVHWDANMLTDYLHLSLMHSRSLCLPPCLLSACLSPSLNVRWLPGLVCSPSKPVQPRNLIIYFSKLQNTF